MDRRCCSVDMDHRCINERFDCNRGEKEVAMKFIMMVLAIRFVAELINNKIKSNKADRTAEANEEVRHPAEYRLR